MEQGSAAALDEATLVEGLRQQRAEAYETLVRAYTPRLLAVARRMLGNEEDARDAVQDAMLSAFRSMPRFEGQARVSTWLHRIVVNAALMKLRTRRRRPEEALEPLMPVFDGDGHFASEVSPWREPADRAAAQAELGAIVREAVRSLPDSAREVLLLRDVEGLDTNETAQALGITANAVKVRLHRARLALRTRLDPHFREGRP